MHIEIMKQLLCEEIGSATIHRCLFSCRVGATLRKRSVLRSVISCVAIRREVANAFSPHLLICAVNCSACNLNAYLLPLISYNLDFLVPTNKLTVWRRGDSTPSSPPPQRLGGSPGCPWCYLTRRACPTPTAEGASPPIPPNLLHCRGYAAECSTLALIP